MTISERIALKNKVAEIVAKHLREELADITPKYSSVFGVHPAHLVSFAVLVVEEALVNKKLVLQRLGE